MTAPQNDAVRRQLYERYTQPILSTLLTTVESYFEQIYRIVPRRTGEEQVSSLLRRLPFFSISDVQDLLYGFWLLQVLLASGIQTSLTILRSCLMASCLKASFEYGFLDFTLHL